MDKNCYVDDRIGAQGKKMKSFIKIVLLLIIPLNLYSQEIIETPDVLDMFSDKTINKEYEPVTLLFDFSKKEMLSYNYSESNDSFSETSLSPGTTNQKNKSTSKLILNILGNGYAEIEYKDIMSDSQVYFDISKDADPISTNFGPRTILYQYLSEDGKFLNNQTIEFRTKIMMPSSSMKIEADKIVEEEVIMPLNFNGSFLQIKGKLCIKGDGIYSIENKQYLKIESRLELNSDNIPDVFKDQLELRIIAEGIYYYDMTEKSYYSGDITITTSFYSKMNGFNPFGSEISQKSNGTEHIKYKKIDND